MVYFIGETMRRPWCVGEMATAVAKDVDIVVAHCSGYTPHAVPELNDLRAFLGDGFSVLVENGIVPSSATTALFSIRDMNSILYNSIPTMRF